MQVHIIIYVLINPFIFNLCWIFVPQTPARRRNQEFASCEEHTDCHQMYRCQMYRKARKMPQHLHYVLDFVLFSVNAQLIVF